MQTPPDSDFQSIKTPDVVDWASLQEHLQRDGLIFVSQRLKLFEAGEAISKDYTEIVQEWIQKALISKPSPEQINQWNQNPSKTFFYLIVQPYVLIQEILSN